MISNGSELMIFMENNCFECIYYDYEDIGNSCGIATDIELGNVSQQMIDTFFNGELEVYSECKEKRAYNG